MAEAMPSTFVDFSPLAWPSSHLPKWYQFIGNKHNVASGHYITFLLVRAGGALERARHL